MGQARHTDWTGALLGGRYRLIRCLGRGGMGAVYEAMQEDLGRRVAVKVVHTHLAQDQDVLARFRREAQAAAALGHPNIVQVTDFQVRDGEPPFLVMEHLVGVSLGQAIGSPGPLSQVRVAFVTSQILSALAAAHSAGIIHRDLKPDNVFLTSIAGVGDIVKILDFGIAKLQAAGPDAHLTQTGEAIGTPVYMAPEQARGRTVDARTDLYATGVCMYEALTGRVPHDPPSYSALIAAILEDAPRPVRELRAEIDPSFAAIVHRALEKDPARRFQSADEMRAAIEPYARASVGPAIAVTAPAMERRAAEPIGATTDVHGAATRIGDARGSDARASDERPSDPRAVDARRSEPRAAEPRTRGAAASAAVLPRTAAQPAVGEGQAEASDSGGQAGASPRASTHAQRGTPVTSSRTLAKPHKPVRWPWVLAVSTLAGAACVGSGLAVIAAVSTPSAGTVASTNASTRPTAGTVEGPTVPPPTVSAPVREVVIVAPSPEQPDSPTQPTRPVATAGLMPVRPPRPLLSAPTRSDGEPLAARGAVPARGVGQAGHPVTWTVATAPSASDGPTPPPTPPLPATAPAPARANAEIASAPPQDARRRIALRIRVTSEPNNMAADNITRNFIRSQNFAGCFPVREDSIIVTPAVFALRFRPEAHLTTEVDTPGLRRDVGVDTCMRIRLRRVWVAGVPQGTTMILAFHQELVEVEDEGDGPTGERD